MAALVHLLVDALIILMIGACVSIVISFAVMMWLFIREEL